MNKSRGLTNRGVLSAVFTSSEYEELFGSGSYGKAIFEINMSQMKQDGYTPNVSQEPEIEEYNNKMLLGRKLGGYDYEPYLDISSDMSMNTVIIHGSIPPKYIHFID